MDAGLKHTIVVVANRIATWSTLLTSLWVAPTSKLQDDGSLVGAAISWTQHHATILMVANFVIVLLCKALEYWFKGQSPSELRLARLASAALDSFRKTCFPEVPSTEPLDNNRVTVFRRVHWKWNVGTSRCWLWQWGWGRWPWSGWLVLTHRSGHTTQSSTTCFLAPDDSNHTEGVAGRAWRCEGAVSVDKLPDLRGIIYVGNLRAIWYRLSHKLKFNFNKESVHGYLASVLTVDDYAKKTYTSSRVIWDRIRSKKQHPLSVLAVPLESKGQRWGVLVLDSSNQFASIEPGTKKFLGAMAKLQTALSSYGVMGS